MDQFLCGELLTLLNSPEAERVCVNFVLISLSIYPSFNIVWWLYECWVTWWCLESWLMIHLLHSMRDERGLLGRPRHDRDHDVDSDSLV